MESSSLIQAFEENIYTDITLILKSPKEEIKIDVHRFVLHSQSQYFKDLFANNLTQKEFEIQVPNINLCKSIIARFYGKKFDVPLYWETKLEYINCCYLFKLCIEKDIIADLNKFIDHTNKKIQILNNMKQIISELIPENKLITPEIISYYSRSERQRVSDTIQNLKSSEHLEKIINILNKDTADIWIITDCLPVIDFSVVSDKSLDEITKYLKTIQKEIINKKGDLVLLLESNTFHLFDIDNNKKIFSVTNDNTIESISFSSCNKLILTADDDKKIKIWSASNGNLLKEIKTEEKYMGTISFSPDSKMIISAHSFYGMIMWDVETGNIIRKIPIDKYISHNDIYFFDNGKKFAITCTKRMWIYDTKTGDLIRESGDIFYNTGMDISPDKKHFAVSNEVYINKKYENRLFIFELETFNVIKEIIPTKKCKYITNVKFHPDGKKIMFSDLEDSLFIADINSGNIIQEKTMMTKRNTIYLNKNQFICTNENENNISIWDISMEKELSKFKTDENITQIAFMNDN